MTETDLWDGKVPTRNRFMGRTFGWGNINPSSWVEDAWFMNINDDELLQYKNGTFERVIINDSTLQVYSVTL